jgi:hypothetical protein
MASALRPSATAGGSAHEGELAVQLFESLSCPALEVGAVVCSQLFEGAARPRSVDDVKSGNGL